MSERRTHYLTALRSACESLQPEVADPGAQRRLEMVVRVLNGLIAQSKTQADLDDAAVSAYRQLLREIHVVAEPNLAAIRTAVERLVHQTSADPGRNTLSTWQRVIEIERAHSEGAARALQAELQAAKTTEQSAQAGGLPDATRLSRYLGDVFKTPVRVSNIDTVSLGFSKATFLLDVSGDASVPTTLVIRMDRANSYLGTTVLDEYPILQALHASGVSVPQPYALEESGQVLGQPFMIVARVYGRGVGSHFNFPPPNTRLCTNMASALAKIHAVPLTALSTALSGQDQSAHDQILADIDKAYADWSALGISVPTMEIAFARLRHHARAASTGPRLLVHGDFSLSNVLIDDDDQIAAILDWEFARLGLPAADLGWCYELATRLASWDEFLAAYVTAGGQLPSKHQLDYFALWAVVRLAVMVFQGQCSFERGELTDIKQAALCVSSPTEMVLRVSRRVQPLLAQ